MASVPPGRVAHHAPLAVTAAGAVSAAGEGVHALFQSIMEATPLASSVDRYPVDGLGTTVAALVPEHTLAMLDACWPDRPRELQLALCAVSEACAQGPLRPDAGLFLGTSLGSTPAWEAWHALALTQGLDEPCPPESGYGDTAPRLARELGLVGPVVTFSTACTSSTAALISAADALRAGELSQALVVGVDCLGPLVHTGFDALHALTPDALTPRPFARDRAGLWLGEGAAAVVLTLGAGGRPLAWYLGGAAAGDGHHMTAPDRHARGMVRAIRGALSEAGVGPGEVSWVSAHATGTRFNDAMEVAALRAVFNEQLPPVHAAKPVLGHTLGASGLLEVVLALEVLRARVRPPTYVPSVLDPELAPLPLDREPAALSPGAVLSLNAAFAGHNTAVALGAP